MVPRGIPKREPPTGRGSGPCRPSRARIFFSCCFCWFWRGLIKVRLGLAKKRKRIKGGMYGRSELEINANTLNNIGILDCKMEIYFSPANGTVNGENIDLENNLVKEGILN